MKRLPKGYKYTGINIQVKFILIEMTQKNMLKRLEIQELMPKYTKKQLAIFM